MKRKLKLAFILDPLDKLYWQEDTSCTIMSESCRRGHDVYGIQMGSLSVSGGDVSAKADRLFVTMEKGIQVLERVEDISMRDMDVVFVRKEPPFDSEYLYLTQMLDLIESDTFVINNPRGLRRYNEKLAILDFPKLAPPHLVTASAPLIKQFQDKLCGSIVLKPLDQKGGTGIHLVDRSDKFRMDKFSQMTAQGRQTVMCQQFIPAVKKTGDVRILLLGGKILGAFARIPQPGNFLANLDQGGIGHQHKLTPLERKIGLIVAKKLSADGLNFVGIDVIGERLSEINVTSPAGVFDINKVSGTKLESQIVDYLESKAAHRKKSGTKK